MSVVNLRSRWLGVSLKQRGDHFKRTWFKTLAREEVLKCVSNRIDFIEIQEESLGITVIAESGGGKTSFLKHLASQYPRSFENGETRVPFMLMKLPRLFTDSALITNALEAIGDPDPSVGKLKERAERLRTLISKCNVKILAVDNFHDIPERKRKTVRTVGNWFRDLVDSTPLLLLTLGTDDAQDVRIFNTQVRRRQMTVLRMDPFELVTQEGKLDWLNLLKQIDEALPLAEESTLSQKGIRGRLYLASRGNFDYLIKLINYAVMIVVKDNRERIELVDLCAAFDSIHGEVSEKSNPFTPDFVLHTLDGPGEVFEGIERGESVKAKGH